MTHLCFFILEQSIIRVANSCCQPPSQNFLVYISCNKGLQGHQKRQQAKGCIEAGLVSQEADGRGSHKYSQIPKGAYRRHRHADRHIFLLAQQGKEHGHDIGTADANGDGSINISDVTALIDMILNNNR